MLFNGQSGHVGRCSREERFPEIIPAKAYRPSPGRESAFATEIRPTLLNEIFPLFEIWRNRKAEQLTRYV